MASSAAAKVYQSIVSQTVKRKTRLTSLTSAPVPSSFRYSSTGFAKNGNGSSLAGSRPMLSCCRGVKHVNFDAVHAQVVAANFHTSTSVYLPRKPTASTALVAKRDADPLIVQTEYPHRYLQTPTAWIESLSQLGSDNKVGLITLSPHIWFQTPQIDIMFEVLKWQLNYKKLLVAWQPTRAELKGGTKKPWPQKGTGRARFKDNRGPGWKKGGTVWGLRGPRSYYYMLPMTKRARALITALSIKLAQDDVHIVDSFDSLPTAEPAYLEALATKRNWGLSVLFVDDTDIMPENIAQAAWDLETFTLMPAYGLNVHDMLKHETLVLTVAAVKRLEERLKLFMTGARAAEKSEKDKVLNITK